MVWCEVGRTHMSWEIFTLTVFTTGVPDFSVTQERKFRVSSAISVAPPGFRNLGGWHQVGSVARELVFNCQRSQGCFRLLSSACQSAPVWKTRITVVHVSININEERDGFKLQFEPRNVPSYFHQGAVLSINWESTWKPNVVAMNVSTRLEHEAQKCAKR